MRKTLICPLKFDCRKNICAWLCVAFFLLFFSPASAALAAPENKQVLFLFAQTPEFPAHPMFEAGFKKKMSEDLTVRTAYSYEYLELTKYSAESDYPERLAQFLQKKYANNQPDIVVTHLGPAADFALKHGRKMFPRAAFFLGVDEVGGVSEHDMPTGFVGVAGTFRAKETVQLILNLQPTVKRIFVVLGSSDREHRTAMAFRRDVADLASTVEFVYSDALSLPQMLEKVASLDTQTAVLYIYVFKDAVGNVFVPAREVSAFSKAAQVPVYVMYSVFMGRGGVGGYVMSTELLGAKAAEYALLRLHGKDSDSGARVIEVENVEYQFDWRQLKRWKIDEQKLPSQSKVLYRELSVWEQYREYLIGVFALIVLLSLLVAGLMINRVRRIEAEKRLVELNQELEEKVRVRTTALTFLNSELQAEVEERNRAVGQLLDSEERYRAMMQQSSDAISLVDVETKTFIEVNNRWLELFGFAPEEVASLKVYDLIADEPKNIDQGYEDIIRAGHGVSVLRQLRRKDGRVFEAERAGSVIKYGGKTVLMFATRDLSAERKLQAQILGDVRLAAEVQQALLPERFDDIYLSLRLVYKPYQVVSGDFYDFTWSQDHQRFSGFVLDVSGHGVSSSLQGIAVSTYFKEILDSPMGLEEKLKWINQRVLRYFTDDTYAAALYFEFDFTRQVLNFATAGVYGFLAASAALPKVVKEGGSLIGITTMPEYSAHSVPIQPGEAFYFMTDGLFERVQERHDLTEGDFEQSAAFLAAEAESSAVWDDCCAVCIRINGEVSFPLRLEFNKFSEYSRVRRRLHDLIKKVGGDQSGRICIAIGEALNNATRESMHVRVKLNLSGRRLSIRIADGGKGFDGNARLKRLQEAGRENSFEERLYAENGRGIMIMAAWMDRVFYNRTGNEVLLVKWL
jgi:PAS domain S-box-containing protein